MIKFETYLGSELNDLISHSDLEKIDSGIRISTLTKIKFNSKYFDIFPIGCTVKESNDNIISTIIIIFSEALSLPFLNKFISCYGQPNTIGQIGELTYQSNSKSTKEGFHQELTKQTYSINEVELSVNPDFISWSNSKYSINIKFDYKIKGTQVIFSEKI